MNEMSIISDYKELITNTFQLYKKLNKHYIIPSNNMATCRADDYVKLHTTDFTKYSGGHKSLCNNLSDEISIYHTKQFGHTILIGKLPVLYFNLPSSEIAIIAENSKAELERVIAQRIADNENRETSLIDAVQAQLVHINNQYQSKNLKKVYRERVIKLVEGKIILERKGVSSIPILKYNKQRHTFAKLYLNNTMSPALARYIERIVLDVVGEIKKKMK